jgi:hypothetical protein
MDYTSAQAKQLSPSEPWQNNGLHRYFASDQSAIDGLQSH